MRPSLIRPQRVTVRPVVRGDTSDEFGDTPIAAKNIRTTSVTGVPAQVTYFSGQQYSPGNPGADRSVKGAAVILKRDAEGKRWTPTIGDILELADGDKLYVTDVQPAFPLQPSLGLPNGGHAGWRLMLSNNEPVRSPAEAG